jgi:hypothetical protein
MVIVPGAIAFTRTSGASAFAKLFVKLITPALATECPMNPGQPRIPPVSEKFTITPCERRNIGAAACATKNGALTFVSSEASHTSSVVEITLPGKKFAALFTSKSRRPSSFPTCKINWRI